MPDRDERTEQPTPRRKQKAREEGRFLTSRELANALQFVAMTVILGQFGGVWIRQTAALMHNLLESALTAQLDPAAVLRALAAVVRSQAPAFSVLAAAVLLAPLALQSALSKTGFTLKNVKPDFGRLDPLRRLRDLPGQNAAAVFQATLVLVLVIWAGWAAGPDLLARAARLALATVPAGLAEIGDLIMGVLWKGAAVLVFLGLVDLFRQWRRHSGELRMTRQEVRDELRESEGNPQVKGKIRRLQRDYSRRRMMQQVPSATAVVVNPTHYAVALRYAMESAGAPVVVAKGRNYLARRIREIAAEHNVPIVENAPLAQALYKSTEVGQEIPAQLYRAVAEILAYVYRIMNGRLPNQGSSA